jgi:hypothetical protein
MPKSEVGKNQSEVTMNDLQNQINKLSKRLTKLEEANPKVSEPLGKAEADSPEQNTVTVTWTGWTGAKFNSEGSVFLARVSTDQVKGELGEGVPFVRSIEPSPSIEGDKIIAKFDLSCFKQEFRHGTWTLFHGDPSGPIHYKTEVDIPPRT